MVQEGKCTCCGSRTIRKYPASMSELDMAFCDCNPRIGEERQVDPENSLVKPPNQKGDLQLSKGPHKT